MPEISLVVCLHREGELLQRLLENARGCHDDLVVVHDGPDETGVRSIVESHGGRFFERPRAYQQEPHWPFAWAQARHDWILRLDADEFPSDSMRAWVQAFRGQPEPPDEVSGYTFIWPLWDGTRARTKKWPRRVCLFDRQRVRYFGMVDQGPIAERMFAPVEHVLHHQPKQKCYGIRYTLLRPKVRRWHGEIARALLGKPTDLPCWRWDSPKWPEKWEQIRKRPLWTGIRRLVLSPYWNARDMIRHGEVPRPSFLTFFPLQHVMMCLGYIQARRRQRRHNQNRPYL